MSEAPLATIRRSTVAGVLFVVALITYASAAFAADVCPTTPLRLPPTGPTSPIRAGSFRTEACRRRTASIGPSVRDPMSSAAPKAGCVSASRNAPKCWPTCRRIFTRSTAARRPDFQTSSFLSSASCPFPMGSIYLQPAVWDSRRAPAKFRATDTILTFNSPGRDRIDDDWSLHGMFTVTWFTSQHATNPTFEPTLSLERDFGPTRDLFVEYVGDYPDQARPSSDSRWRRLLAGDKSSATRFSCRLRAKQQFSRSLLRHRVFVSPRRTIPRDREINFIPKGI